MGPELTKEGIDFNKINILVEEINDFTHITITTPVGYSIKKIGDLGYEHHFNNPDPEKEILKIISVDWRRAVPNHIYDSQKERSFILKSLFKHKKLTTKVLPTINLSDNDTEGGKDENN